MKIAWRRFLPYAWPEWRGIALLAVLSIVGIGVEALLPWPLKLIVDDVLPGKSLPEAGASLARMLGASSAAELLFGLAASLFVLYAANQLLQLVKGVLQAHVASRIQYTLAGEVLDRLQALSLTFHARSRKGDLARRIAVDTESLPNLITGVMLPAATSLVALVVFFVVMWQLDASLAVIAALVSVPMVLIMRFFGSRMTERAYEHQQKEGEVWSVAEQALSSLPVVQAFGREEHEVRRFDQVAGRTIRAYLRTISTQLQFKVGVDGCEAIGTALILFVGGLQVLGGKITLGTLLVFLSYLTALYAPLLTFAYLSATLAGAAASARRIIEVLDADEQVHERSDAVDLRVASRMPHGSIAFDNVAFGYRPGTPVLKRIGFEIKAGETIALVGSTGAGKTTLVSLIPRLFDPWQGRVLVNGVDVRDATLASLRAEVAFVLQDPFLLPISVADNIAYGVPGASRAEIVEASLAANADEFIRELPDGYDSVIGERGATLSGGQRQRIAIARALLKNASILILDEPTSALDAANERLVMGAIELLMRGRTTLIIAHRLSTIGRADRVFVVEHGEIVEHGRHDDLMKSGGTYSRFLPAADRIDENVCADDAYRPELAP